jgi:hypothetical protein
MASRPNWSWVCYLCVCFSHRNKQQWLPLLQALGICNVSALYFNEAGKVVLDANYTFQKYNHFCSGLCRSQFFLLARCYGDLLANDGTYWLSSNGPLSWGTYSFIIKLTNVNWMKIHGINNLWIDKKHTCKINKNLVERENSLLHSLEHDHLKVINLQFMHIKWLILVIAYSKYTTFK